MVCALARLHPNLASSSSPPIYLHLEETLIDLDKGRYHRGRAAVLRAIMQRPA